VSRIVVLVVCLFATNLLAAEQRFGADDLTRVVRVSDPQIAPDGKTIVVVVGRANLKTNKYDAELVLVDIATREQHLLTHDRVVSGYPRWSPSGDRLAYIAEDNDHRAQIFVLSMRGGDSLQLTHAAGAVSQFAWKPDGKAIAFAATDEVPRREGEAKFLDAFEVLVNDSLVSGRSPSTHLWLIDAIGGEARRLTSGDWSLPVSFPPGSPSSPLNWSADGKLIAFVKAVSPLSGDAERTQIELLDVASGQFRPLTQRTALESYPLLSPDGSKVAYWYPRDGKVWFNNEIRVVGVNGGADHSETAVIDRNFERVLWTSDSRALVVAANDGTTVGVWIKPLDGAARRVALGQLTAGGLFWFDYSVGSHDQLALCGTTPDRATELYYLPTLDSAPVRLTDFNAALDSRLRGRSETVTWVSDNVQLDGVLTYPPDFMPGRKYPLVLDIHGGPTYASRETFDESVQYLAAQGWLVFEPNYRGSDNRGNQFVSAIYKDTGAGPGRDVMAGVEMLERRGFVDASKMAVSGWSYGGYMTTWLLGHYDVWKAAVAGAAVTDWVTMYALSDGNVTIADQVGGSPYRGDSLKTYREQSPVSFAQRIHAPTLILSDTGDTRVPIANSYELFRALSDNGVTTQFFAYPIAGHYPDDPLRNRDIWQRWVAWIGRYVGTDSVGPSTPAPTTK